MEVMNHLAVSIKNIGFGYSGQSSRCFSNLNLEVKLGERFGLFGPNGAGKTTLLHCLTGVLSHQEGSIQLFDNDITKNKK